MIHSKQITQKFLLSLYLSLANSKIYNYAIEYF